MVMTRHEGGECGKGMYHEPPCDPPTDHDVRMGRVTPIVHTEITEAPGDMVAEAQRAIYNSVTDQVMRDLFDEAPKELRPYLVSWWLKRKDRKHVLEWIRDEWAAHSDDKYASQLAQHERVFREEGIGVDSWWRNIVLQYWQRATLVGIDTPEGQQLLMKTATTILDCCATMIRVYGDPPLPGYPSGEIHFRGEQRDSRE